MTIVAHIYNWGKRGIDYFFFSLLARKNVMANQPNHQGHVKGIPSSSCLQKDHLSVGYTDGGSVDTHLSKKLLIYVSPLPDPLTFQLL